MLNGPQWRFATEVYARTRVSESCLYLQDNYCIDVSFLLFALFLARHQGHVLSRKEIADADAHVREWRETIIKPLRMVRHRLKNVSASSSKHDDLRKTVATAELRAEKIELASLLTWSQDLSGGTGEPVVDENALRELSVAIVTFFATKNGGSWQGELSCEALDAIALVCSAAIQHDTGRNL